MPNLILIIHNVRSAHNVGSLLRSADGLGVEMVYLSGYSPYPVAPDDNRLPHLAERAQKMIQKTALGAEKNVSWEHRDDLMKLISELQTSGYTVAALEQSPKSKMLTDYKPPQKIVIVVGPERDGLTPDILEKCDVILEIPMFGQKESFNVAVAGAIALYHFRCLA